MNEPAELLLAGANEDPGFLLRLASSSTIQWLVRLEMATQHGELPWCQRCIGPSAHTQGCTVGSQQDLRDICDQ